MKPAAAGFLLPNRVHHHHDIFHAPQKIRYARLHCRRRLDRLVNLHEVVDHEINKPAKINGDLWHVMRVRPLRTSGRYA